MREGTLHLSHTYTHATCYPDAVDMRPRVPVMKKSHETDIGCELTGHTSPSGDVIFCFCEGPAPRPLKPTR